MQPQLLPNNVLAALASGRKLQAIKLFREATGLGLKEAKQQIDAAEAALRDGTVLAPGQPAKHNGLAPGAVPRGGARRWLAWVLFAGLAVCLWIVIFKR
jgi:hypothetical protein